MFYRLKNAIDILKGGVNVVINNCDMMISLQKKLNSYMGTYIANSSRHKYIFCHSLIIKSIIMLFHYPISMRNQNSIFNFLILTSSISIMFCYTG